MPGGPKDKALKDDLVIHLAAGGSRQEFADKHPVSIATVYRWCKEPAVKDAVADHARERIGQGLNRLSSKAPWVVDNLTKLAESGKREDAVKLGATREMLVQLVNLANWSDIDKRLSEVEASLAKQRKGHR